MRRKFSTPPFAHLLPAATLSTSLLFALPLEAATVTWGSGGADNNWSTAANWDTDATPTHGDDLVFTGVGETVNHNLLIGGVSFPNLNSISFDSAAGAFVVTSSYSMSLDAGVTNQSNQLQTLNIKQIGLKQTQTWDAGTGGLNIGAELAYSGGADLDLTFTGAGDTSISGQIRLDSYSEKLGLIKNGSGTLTLSATNGYHGDTTINAGVVSISSAANLGRAKSSSGGDVILNGGTLQTTGSFSLDKDFSVDDPSGGTVETASGTTLTLTGVVSGAGDLVKSGDGTLVLTGTNTFSDDLTVEAGTVSVSSDANLGGAASWLYLDGGTLQTTADFSTSRTFEMGAGHGTLSTDSGTTLSLNGVVQGAGNLTKSGDGTLVLAGTNTYSGATTVNAGTLSVNGSIANSATTINSGGTLGGSGTVGNVTLNGGTLAPGNSIGTLNVSGDVTFGSGVYEVEVDAAGNSDKIIATGNADLSGARVSVLPEAGSYAASTDYTILQAGTVSNTFTGVSVDDTDFAFLDASLSYSATDVTLTLARNDNDYGSVARTDNQRSVGNALQELNDGAASSGINDLLGEINILSSTAARSAYDQLSGVGHGNSLLMTRQSQQRFGRMMNNRAQQQQSQQGLQLAAELASSPVQLASQSTPAAAHQAAQPTQHRYWITPVYGQGDVDSDDNASGMDYHYAGLSLGLDQQLNQDWLLGAALSYTRSDARFAAGSTDMDGVELALYSRWDRGVSYLQGYAGLGWYGSDSERQINVGGSQTAESDYDTSAFFGGIEGGHRLMLNADMMLTPYAGLGYGYSDREGFSESGAGAANLEVAGETLESIQSTAGVRFEQFFSTSQGTSMAWNLNAAWLHEFGDTQARTQAGFINNSFANFSVAGPDLDRDRLLLGTGLAVAMNGQSSLSLDYNGEFAGTDEDQRISASYHYRW